MRMTQRNYYGKAFVPGYAPKCSDKATCEFLMKVTERLATLEDMLEQPDVLNNIPQEIILQLQKKGIIE